MHDVFHLGIYCLVNLHDYELCDLFKVLILKSHVITQKSASMKTGSVMEFLIVMIAVMKSTAMVRNNY